VHDDNRFNFHLLLFLRREMQITSDKSINFEILTKNDGSQS
jgi:hypothetical protein